MQEESPSAAEISPEYLNRDREIKEKEAYRVEYRKEYMITKPKRFSEKSGLQARERERPIA